MQFPGEDPHHPPCYRHEMSKDRRDRGFIPLTGEEQALFAPL
jgi:hypothetical protein